MNDNSSLVLSSKGQVDLPFTCQCNENITPTIRSETSPTIYTSLQVPLL